MAHDEATSDQDLIQRFSAGEETAFDCLYERHDPAILRFIARRLRDLPDQEHLARQIADFLWLRLHEHPQYLLSHDCSCRPLSAYLAFLARREAGRFRSRMQAKGEPHLDSLGDADVVDPSIEDDLLADRWGEIAEILPARTFNRLVRIWRKSKPTKTEQRWQERLIQQLKSDLEIS